MEEIKLTDHQRNRLENLRVQHAKIENEISLLMIDIIDGKGRKLKENGKLSYNNGLFTAELIPHSAVVKDRLKRKRH